MEMKRSSATPWAAAVLASTAALLIGSQVAHASKTFSFSGVNNSGTTNTEAAQAVFDVVSGHLIVTLTNEATFSAFQNGDVLTALFWKDSSTPTLSPVSAKLANGSTLFNPDPSIPGSWDHHTVGGEWELLNSYQSLSGQDTFTAKSNLNGQNIGLSSTGIDGFGHANFPGPDLSPPASALDGPNGGLVGSNITSLGGGATSLIKNSAVYDLGAVGINYSLSSISNVLFQYGTSESEFHQGATTIITTQQTVPEPTSLATAIIGIGGLGLAGLRRLCRRPAVA